MRGWKQVKELKWGENWNSFSFSTAFTAYKGMNKNWTKTSNVLLKVTLHVLPTHYNWQREGESRRRNWNEGKTEIHFLFLQQRSKVFSCLFNILLSEKKREETTVANIMESTVRRTSQNQRDVLQSAGNVLYEAHKQAHFYLHAFYPGKVYGVEECIRAPTQRLVSQSTHFCTSGVQAHEQYKRMLILLGQRTTCACSVFC